MTIQVAVVISKKGPKERESCWRVFTTAMFEDCEEAALGAAPVRSSPFSVLGRSAASYLEDIREGRRGGPLLASPRSGTGRDPGVSQSSLSALRRSAA